MQQKPKIKIRTISFEVFKKVAGAIRAFSIMTPRYEIECCKPNDLLNKQLQIMKDKGFDVIPILKRTDLETGEFSEYLSQEKIEEKIKQGFKNCEDAATKIEEEDKIVEDLPMDEVIRKFSSRKNKSRIPLFLRNENNQITGLMTLADLDKTALKMYLFALISELELSLLQMVSKDYYKLREVCRCKYCVGKRKEREKRMLSHDNLEEYYYLNLKELIHIIITPENLCDTHRRVKNVLLREGHGEIVKLRNTIAHPKPLVSDKFPISKLARIHSLIKSLLSICKDTSFSNNKLDLEMRCLGWLEPTKNTRTSID